MIYSLNSKRDEAPLQIDATVFAFKLRRRAQDKFGFDISSLEFLDEFGLSLLLCDLTVNLEVSKRLSGDLSPEELFIMVMADLVTVGLEIASKLYILVLIGWGRILGSLFFSSSKQE